MQKKLISIVIPVYNEQKGLSFLFNELLHHTNNTSQHFDYEIIFVNDGSDDESWKIIQNFAHAYSFVKGICFSQNFGYQYALTAGYDYAQGDAVITMDSDMQHPPSLIIGMIEQWQKGFHIVYAQRINRNDTFLKKFTAYCYYAVLQSISTITIPRNISDFRLLDKLIVIQLRKMREKPRYLRGLVAWLSFNHSFVNYEQPSRLVGVTKYTWAKLFKIALDGIINFSMPFIYIAYCSLFIGVSLFITITYIFNNISNVEDINLAMALFSLPITGILIITLLIGMYLELIYAKALKRPPYSIIQKINC